MNLIDVMGLGTVALRGICRLNVRFGSDGVHRPRLCENYSPITFRGLGIRYKRFRQSNDPRLSGRDRSQHALHSDNLDHALHVVS